MKYLKIILLFSCLIQVKNSKAQGNNLQFNQAIFLTISGNGSNATTQNFTVPNNKVWKIESAAAGYFNLNGTRYPGGTLSINDITIYSCPILYGGTSAYVNLSIISNLPIWLPTGSYSMILSSEPTLGAKGFISGVEYNLVP
jgi:hypothetical protein